MRDSVAMVFDSITGMLAHFSSSQRLECLELMA
jgi:hypothetical protein